MFGQIWLQLRCENLKTEHKTMGVNDPEQYGINAIYGDSDFALKLKNQLIWSGALN